MSTPTIFRQGRSNVRSRHWGVTFRLSISTKETDEGIIAAACFEQRDRENRWYQSVRSYLGRRLVRYESYEENSGASDCHIHCYIYVVDPTPYGNTLAKLDGGEGIQWMEPAKCVDEYRKYIRKGGSAPLNGMVEVNVPVVAGDTDDMIDGVEYEISQMPIGERMNAEWEFERSLKRLKRKRRDDEDDELPVVKRTRFSDRLKEAVDNGATMKYIRREFFNNMSAIKMYHNLKYGLIESLRNDITIAVVKGATGIGKTYTTNEVCESFCLSKWNNGGFDHKWWDGYDYEDVVVFDEFDSSKWQVGHFNRLTQKDPYDVEVKYGGMRIRPKAVIILTNYDFHEWFMKESNHIRDTVKRRIEFIDLPNSLLTDNKFNIKRGMIKCYLVGYLARMGLIGVETAKCYQDGACVDINYDSFSDVATRLGLKPSTYSCT